MVSFSRLDSKYCGWPFDLIVIVVFWIPLLPTADWQSPTNFTAFMSVLQKCYYQGTNTNQRSNDSNHVPPRIGAPIALI